MDARECRCQHWSPWNTGGWKPRRGEHHPECPERHARGSCDCLSCKSARGEWTPPKRLLASERDTMCPHARPSWRMCPWCLGLNDNRAHVEISTSPDGAITMVSVKDAEAYLRGVGGLAVPEDDSGSK